MNRLVLISGIFALLTTIGHFAVGTKQFLMPMLGLVSRICDDTAVLASRQVYDIAPLAGI